MNRLDCHKRRYGPPIHVALTYKVWKRWRKLAHFLIFFFWPHPQPVKVLQSGIRSTLQWWSAPQLQQHRHLPHCVTQELQLFFFLTTLWHMEFLSQGSDPSYICKPMPQLWNHWILTHCAMQRVELVSRSSRDSPSPVAPQWELPFPHFLYWRCG